jgi:hypothetical protein
MNSTLRRSALRLLLPCAILIAPEGLSAQHAPIPSPQEVLGYPLGRYFTDYAGVREYSRLLAEVSPRVDYRVYGNTPQRRELIQLVISSPENLARLDAILAANAELVLPATSANRAAEIARSNPAVVFFSYGVHGNESSSSEAALWTAWDLARAAPEVSGSLDSLVVVIDPVANPDGRERYVQWFRSVVGARPNPRLNAREHHEPWPGGRFNHYLFDLNRDWAWATQPETRARLATWWRWNPQVHVDFHEMSHNSSYFFFPAADPINPIYPPYVLDWARRFGEANARAFDAQGWPYYTAEAFDLFYPGYGDSWPSLTGAIGMTYEQAGHGRAGLAVERADGDTLTLHQRAEQHRAAGLATLRAATAGKTRLLMDFAEGHRTIGVGERDVLLVPGPDAARIRELVDHLRGQGIEVERADRSFSASATAYAGFDRRSRFPAGTYRVRARQPRGRLALTLLQRETELRAEYSYDISAWSLPFAYGVEAHRVSGTPAGIWEPAAGTPAGLATAPEPGLGYLVAPGAGAAPGIVRFLDDGGVVRVLARATTRGGREWPAGSWFLPARGNEGLRGRAEAAGLAADVVAVAGGLAEAGIDLGSDQVVPVTLPRVALLAEEPVSPTSFGAHWYYLEQVLRLPFDAIRASDVSRIDLGDYDVIVVPESGDLGDRATGALEEWVRGGGRLVAVGSSAGRIGGLVDARIREPEADDGDDVRGRYLQGRREREREAWRDQIPGTVLQARMDPAHPLTWGAATAGNDRQLFVLHRGGRVFEPARGLEAAVHFPADVARIAGVISQESLDRLAEGAWLVTARLGRGSVVLFADDPLFRLFWHATHPLYVNALLLGPQR